MWLVLLRFISCMCGFCRSRQLKPIIVDPGLYLSEKSEMFYATQKRDLPNSFRLFTGLFSSLVLIVLLEAFCTDLMHDDGCHGQRRDISV